MVQSVTINGHVNEFGEMPIVSPGTKQERAIVGINGYKAHGVNINGFDYPSAEANSILYYPGLPGYGSTIWDRSKEGNHGTITGATWKRTTGGVWCLSFDGTDDYVDSGDDVSLDITSQITLMAFVTMNEAVGSVHYIMGRDDGTNRNYHLVVNESGYTQFLIRIGGVSKFRATAVAYEQGRCYIMAGTYDGATLKVYRISSGGTSVEVLTGLSGSIDNTDVSFWMGKRPDGSFPAHADIGLPQVLNVALTQAQLENIFATECCLIGV